MNDQMTIKGTEEKKRVTSDQSTSFGKNIIFHENIQLINTFVVYIQH